MQLLPASIRAGAREARPCSLLWRVSSWPPFLRERILTASIRREKDRWDYCLYGAIELAGTGNAYVHLRVLELMRLFIQVDVACYLDLLVNLVAFFGFFFPFSPACWKIFFRTARAVYLRAWHNMSGTWTIIYEFSRSGGIHIIGGQKTGSSY